MEKEQQVIAEKIRPILQKHNGDLELVEVTADGFAKVRLTGACATCPGAQQTLAETVEAILREECPEIQGVIPVHETSPDLIQQALHILRRDRNIVHGQ